MIGKVKWQQRSLLLVIFVVLPWDKLTALAVDKIFNTREDDVWLQEEEVASLRF